MEKTPAMDLEQLSDEEAVPTEATEEGRATKRRRVEVDQLEKAIACITKDFEKYKAQMVRRGTPVLEESDVTDKYARAINAIGAYRWYKGKPISLPVKKFEDWKK